MKKRRHSSLMSTIKHILNLELKYNNRKVVGLGLRVGVWKLIINYSYAVVKQEVVWTFRIDSFCFHIGNKMWALFCLIIWLLNFLLWISLCTHIFMYLVVVPHLLYFVFLFFWREKTKFKSKRESEKEEEKKSKATIKRFRRKKWNKKEAH